MEKELLESIDAKLSAVIALLSYGDVPKDEKLMPEVIISRSDQRFNATKIARMLGKKPDTVVKSLNRAANK